jgi:hypothetical protein
VVGHLPLVKTSHMSISKESDWPKKRSCVHRLITCLLSLLMLCNFAASCAGVRCRFGARCVHGDCVCPQSCPGMYQPVCGEDGITYSSECRLQQHACHEGREIRVQRTGTCEEVSGSGS